MTSTTTNQTTQEELLLQAGEDAVKKDIASPDFVAIIVKDPNADLATLFKELTKISNSADDADVFINKLYTKRIAVMDSKITELDKQKEEIDSAILEFSRLLNGISDLGIDLNAHSGGKLSSVNSNKNPFAFTASTNFADFDKSVNAGLAHIRLYLKNLFDQKEQRIHTSIPKDLPPEAAAAIIVSQSSKLESERNSAMERIKKNEESFVALCNLLRRHKINSSDDYSAIEKKKSTLESVKERIPKPDFEKLYTDYEKICNAQIDRQTGSLSKPSYNSVTGSIIPGYNAKLKLTDAEKVQLLQTAASSSSRASIKTSGLVEYLIKEAKTEVKAEFDKEINDITQWVRNDETLSIGDSKKSLKNQLSRFINSKHSKPLDKSRYIHRIALAYGIDIPDSVIGDETKIVEELAKGLLAYIQREIPKALPTIDSHASKLEDRQKAYRDSKPKSKEENQQKLLMSTRYSVAKELMQYKDKNLTEMSPTELEAFKADIVTKILAARLKNLKAITKSTQTGLTLKASNFGSKISEYLTDNRALNVRGDLVYASGIALTSATALGTAMMFVDGGLTLMATKGLTFVGSAIAGRMVGRANNIKKYNRFFGKFRKIKTGEEYKEENAKLSVSELQEMQAAQISRALRYGATIGENPDADILSGVDASKYGDIAGSLGNVKNLMQLEREALTNEISDFLDTLNTDASVKKEDKNGNKIVTHILEKMYDSSHGSESAFLTKFEEAQKQTGANRLKKGIFSGIGVGIGVGTGFML
jgi:hypothetical protein